MDLWRDKLKRICFVVDRLNDRSGIVKVVVNIANVLCDDPDHLISILSIKCLQEDLKIDISLSDLYILIRISEKDAFFWQSLY